MTSSRLAVDVTLSLGPLHLAIDLKSDARTLSISGPSGAGKSTLLRILAGVESRGQGAVRFGGATWQEGARFVPAWERRVGWVPQDALLFPHLTVMQNLEYAAPASPLLTEVASGLVVEELLQRRPRLLSGGERQRVALARALLAEPALLLLDEPFSAMDRPLRARVLDFLSGWCETRDLPLVLVSHEHDDSERIAVEHWRLAGGRVARAE